jgi:hypothetical protein
MNPLFKNDAYDTDSLGSGDSVLIGVEDQAEFKNYKGHKDVGQTMSYNIQILMLMKVIRSP